MREQSTFCYNSLIPPLTFNNMTKQLPADFIQQTTSLLGASEAASLFEALTETSASTSVRRNPKKDATPLHERFSETSTAPVAWCAEGAYLESRPSFILDPALHAGAYYVQEAASMFLEQAIHQILSHTTPQRVLDLCAAPGGKSTLWRSLLPDGALLVANEPMHQRAEVLAENLTKWGHPDIVVTNAYPEAFHGLKGFFDVIGADVPCSGEGMFRKDDVAISEWSLHNVMTCADRQWQIVCDIWDCLREGGFMVYSTCTFNREENENMVAKICKQLGAEVVPLAVEATWNIHTLSEDGKVLNAAEANNGMYHFYPHKTRGEGLFLCLLHKTSEAPSLKPKKDKAQRSGKPSTAPDVQKSLRWLNQPADFTLMAMSDCEWAAVRKALADDIARIHKNIKCLTCGIPLAELRGRKLVPLHGLALSQERAPQAFPTCEVDVETAIAYLRREAINIDAPLGWVIISHKGLSLGFVNNLGNRANNQYPQAWRIRKSV